MCLCVYVLAVFSLPCSLLLLYAHCVFLCSLPRYHGAPGFLLVLFILEAVLFAFFFFLRWHQKDDGELFNCCRTSNVVLWLGYVYCLVTVAEVVCTHVFMEGSQAFREAATFVSLVPVMATLIDTSLQT
jgi:hypothetical protein